MWIPSLKDDMINVNIITLGCAKNLVDSEYLSRQLSRNGYQVTHEGALPCDVMIINTCGFINDAKQESVETILEYAQKKEQGDISRLYVMGCLSQRYRQELAREIPEVDGFFGVYEQHSILESLQANFYEDSRHQRQLATPAHYAYLKVAEGCNRKCSFCSIPLIKGNYNSKSIEELQKEADYLAGNGVKELNLIAQDLSYYGRDLYSRNRLSDLLNVLEQMEAFDWIRLLYAYPAGFPTRVLDRMGGSASICHYLDIPIQHISDRLLKRMRRGHDRKQTEQLINLIKSKVPDVTLRTTLLVGYPGERDRDFSELMEFVGQVRFDRLGVFTYSEEEGTYSERHEKDDVPEHVKRERADELMALQQEIALEKNQQMVGKKMRVLVDEADEHYIYARSAADAPEVDNGVIIPANNGTTMEPGNFYDVIITEATDYDLYARPDS